MKNIVRFSIVEPSDEITVDKFDDLFKTESPECAFMDLIPYNKIFKKIIVVNFYTIPASLLSRLTNQYLHGAEIIFSTPKRGFWNSYKMSNPSKFYSYKWCLLDLFQPIPKSLADFKFMYKGQEVTYLEALKTLKSTNYLDNEIWNALDLYSQAQIQKCKEKNKGDYAQAEQWYKNLMKDCKAHNIAVFSPNKKTYYEAMAEIDFEKECEQARLKKGLRPLNTVELAFLKKYAPAYGVEIPQFQFRYNTRKTKDGYTQEPERVYNGMSTSDWSRVIYDCRNRNNLPKNIRNGLSMQSCESDKYLRDAYFNLLWIMKHLKDDGLMPGYHRCPKCHEIYREHDGCECGYCKPIEFIQADNLLYGISSTYEDYGYTKDMYTIPTEEYEDMLDNTHLAEDMLNNIETPDPDDME